MRKICPLKMTDPFCRKSRIACLFSLTIRFTVFEILPRIGFSYDSRLERRWHYAFATGSNENVGSRGRYCQRTTEGHYGRHLVPLWFDAVCENGERRE